MYYMISSALDIYVLMYLYMCVSNKNMIKYDQSINVKIKILPEMSEWGRLTIFSTTESADSSLLLLLVNRLNSRAKDCRKLRTLSYC